MLSLLQCAVWNTFGPIYESVNYAYDWSDTTVALQANWGTFTFIIIVFPLCWLLERYGLRITTIVVSTLVACGATLRFVSTHVTVFSIFANVCSILNGFAGKKSTSKSASSNTKKLITGATIMSSPPALSAIWFPPEERTTATCINQVFNMLGNGVSFVVGPLLVSDTNLNTTSKEVIRSDIQLYMGIEAAVAIVLWLLFIVYFPKEPPTPPSASASIPRTDFKEGMKTLLRNKNVLLCTFGYGLSGGIIGAWQGVMAINFRPLGVDDEESGYVGLVTCLATAPIAILTAYLTDHIRKHMKVTLVILLVLEALSFTWLTLLCDKIIPFR